MYGSYNGTPASATDDLKNELVFTNLISIANNQHLYGMLDDETRNSLDDMIRAYTKANLKAIIEKELLDDKKIIQEYDELDNGISNRF